jgi:hypothetical protein
MLAARDMLTSAGGSQITKAAAPRTRMTAESYLSSNANQRAIAPARLGLPSGTAVGIMSIAVTLVVEVVTAGDYGITIDEFNTEDLDGAGPDGTAIQVRVIRVGVHPLLISRGTDFTAFASATPKIRTAWRPSLRPTSTRLTVLTVVADPFRRALTSAL